MVLYTKILNVISSILNLFFVKECVICKRELIDCESHFCIECLHNIPFTYSWHRESQRYQSLFFYKGRFKELLYSIKYGGNKKLALYLGSILGEKIVKYLTLNQELLKRVHFPIFYLVPVPIHWKKRIKRGYNQSYYIAKGFAKYINEFANGQDNRGIKVEILDDILIRIKNSKSQTKLSKNERGGNIIGAFKLNRKYKDNNSINSTKDLKFIIIDDVFTTGATTSECSKVLKENFICSIIVCTLALDK